MPKVSVLMGVYNCAETVGKSIESISSQTFTDWELIICDDGSKDKTTEVITDYAMHDKRIIVLYNDRNRGLSYTLNRCLNVASGEYCARMDGDDTCDMLRFEKQVTFLENHPEYGFVSTKMIRFDEDGVYSIPNLREGYSPDQKAFIHGSPFCHAPVMMRRCVYDLVSGYRDIPQTLGVEDYDLWFRIYSKGIKGYVLPEPLYSMFDGRGAMKRRTFRRRLNEAWVRKEGYKLLGVPFIKRIYVFKPIIIGLIPKAWFIKLRAFSKNQKTHK